MFDRKGAATNRSEAMRLSGALSGEDKANLSELMKQGSAIYDKWETAYKARRWREVAQIISEMDANSAALQKYLDEVAQRTEPEPDARDAWNLKIASEFRPDALPPLVLAAMDSAKARILLEGGSRDDVLHIIATEGRVNSQLTSIAADYKQRFARERIQDAKRKYGNIPTVVPSMTDKQVLRLFLAQVEELTSAILAFQQEHDMTDISGAGRLILHLWSLEGMNVPASAAEFWNLRRTCVEKYAQALRQRQDSADTERLWKESQRLLMQSAELEAAIRAEMRSNPPPAAPGADTSVQVAASVARAKWTQQRIRWLAMAAHDLQLMRASPAVLIKDGRINEDDEDLMLAIGTATTLAFEAEKQWVLERPKRATRMADEALALYNFVAKAVGAPPREIDSAEPVEPEQLKTAREARERKAREEEERRARTWNRWKVRTLGDLIDNLPETVPPKALAKLQELHHKASGLAYHYGNHISGPKYDDMAKAAEECLAAYNRLVPDSGRKTVRDL